MQTVKFDFEDVSLNLFVNWGADSGCGFGQLRVNAKDGLVHCANEYMSKTKVKQILHALVDDICDKMSLDDTPTNDRPFTPMPRLQISKLALAIPVNGLPKGTIVDGECKNGFAKCSHPLVDNNKPFYLLQDEVTPVVGW